MTNRLPWPPSIYRFPLLCILIVTVFSISVIGCSGSDPVNGEEPDEPEEHEDDPNEEEEEEDREVMIISPEEGAIESESSVLIEGTAEGVSEVEVNGETVEVEDEQWAITLEFDDGEVTATASIEDDESSVDFIVDTQAPDFTIETPERGTVLDAEDSDATQEITVAGIMHDPGPSGLLVIEVEGQFVEPDDQGQFETQVSLDEGLNVITVTAIDNAHHERKERRALIYGPLTDANTPIDEAAQVDIDNPDGLGSIAAVIEAYITPEQIQAFIDAGEDDGQLPVDLDEIDWEDIQVELIPHDGYLQVSVTLTDLTVAGQFQLNGGGDASDGQIEIGHLKVTLDIALSADDDNNLNVEVIDDEVEIEDITVNVDGQDQDWAEPVVTAVIVYAFNAFIGDLLEDNLFDPDILTQQVEFLNRTIEITFLIEDIVISSRGISARLGLEFPGDKHPEVPTVAGALNRPVSDSFGGSVDRSILFHSKRQTFDRVLHSLWYSGLIHQQLSNDDLEETDIPFELTANGLATLLDNRIREIHEPDTPAELRLRPLLAPVLEFDSQGAGTVYLGDFLMDFLLVPDASTETLVLTVALQIELEVGFEIGAEEVEFDLDVTAVGDVADEPKFSLDHSRTVGFITDLLELIPVLAGSDLNIESETTLEWASITNPEVLIHGAEDDQITVGVDIEPVEEFIEDDEVDAGGD